LGIDVFATRRIFLWRQSLCIEVPDEQYLFSKTEEDQNNGTAWAFANVTDVETACSKCVIAAKSRYPMPVNDQIPNVLDSRDENIYVTDHNDARENSPITHNP
jgi:hypothetical protein